MIFCTIIIIFFINVSPTWQTGANFMAASSQWVEYKCASLNGTHCSLHNINTTKDEPNFIIASNVPEKVTTLAIWNSSIPILTEEVCRTFPKLHTFHACNSSITEITTVTFRSCRNLFMLDMRQNQLTELKSGRFEDLKRLEKLDLSENRIKSIPVGIFVGLDKLHSLDLARNMLVLIDLEVFDPLKNLKKLYLGGNNLVIFDVDLILQQTPITRISIRDNDFECSHLFNVLQKLRNAKVTFDPYKYALKKRPYEILTLDRHECIPPRAYEKMILNDVLQACPTHIKNDVSEIKSTIIDLKDELGSLKQLVKGSELEQDVTNKKSQEVQTIDELRLEHRIDVAMLNDRLIDLAKLLISVLDVTEFAKTASNETVLSMKKIADEIYVRPIENKEVESGGTRFCLWSGKIMSVSRKRINKSN